MYLNMINDYSYSFKTAVFLKLSSYTSNFLGFML
jgi:hypothetical protein